MFLDLYDICVRHMKPKTVNKRVKLCETVCALKTREGNYYYGVCLSATCGLGFCAEQSAISKMICDGQTQIEELLVIDKYENMLPPCGRCLELITQLSLLNNDTKVYLAKDKYLTIAELYPHDWKTLKDNNMREIKNSDYEKYNLKRFIKAQNEVYYTVLEELRNGHKITDWMWYIFPQLKGLGMSETSSFNGIEGREELKAYCENKLLIKRYLECCKILSDLKTDSSTDIFGSVDSKKLKSSLTLFYLNDDENRDIYKNLLDKFYGGEFDTVTIEMLSRQDEKEE